MFRESAQFRPGMLGPGANEPGESGGRRAGGRSARTKAASPLPRTGGGVTAALLWELTRRFLIWYFSTLSFVNVVYGALATSIVILLSLEAAAIILLLGAQVIASYERIGTDVQGADGLRT